MVELGRGDQSRAVGRGGADGVERGGAQGEGREGGGGKPIVSP